ncbi:MAG: hypothetical protein LQ339_000404 [Xanthoria mediterranea]|nr:MAG: hypothetical protein LQ339_000404 [Xanthoria mediterranea]
MPPYKHQSSSRDIKDRAHAICGRKLDFKTASKFLAQQARKQSKSQSTTTGRSDSKVAKKRVHETAHASRNRTKTNESRSQAALVQSSTPAVGSKKRDRDEHDEPQNGGSNKRSKLEKQNKPRSQGSLPGPDGRRNVTASGLTSALSSKIATSDQNISVTGPLKRKSEDGHDSPAKKAKVENTTLSPIIPPAPASTTTAANSAEPTNIVKNTSIKTSPKRKAEDDIGATIKHSKIELPVENATSASTSKVAEAVMARKGHKQGNGVRSANPAIADNSKRGDECCEERAVQSDTIKTANIKVAQVTHSEERAIALETGEVKPAEANRAEKSGPPTAEKQSNPDEARRPARMANADLMCFANSVIQVIDSIPELRDRLIAKATLNDDPAFPAFPTRTGSKKADEKAEAQWHAKIARILREQNRTFGQCLGQTLRHMQAAAQMGDTVCTRGLMNMFSALSDEYDGVSAQQEAFDFLDKVFQRWEQEDSASDDVNKQDQPPVRDLFKGQKFTQIECTCGHSKATDFESAYSLQLKIANKSRSTTIPSCLNRAFATVRPEGYLCEFCKQKQTASNKEYIRSWGDYLILHLDRAELPDEKGKIKYINTKIDVPPQLNLDDFIHDGPLPVSTEEVEGRRQSSPTVKYEPVAFIERDGEDSGDSRSNSKQDETRLSIFLMPLRQPTAPPSIEH